MAVQLVLFDINEAMVDAWSEAFLEGLWHSEHVEIRMAPLEDVDDCQALILPGNSYGIMDDGLEGSAKKLLGDEVEETLQGIIRAYFLGEMQVGQAVPMNFEPDDPSPFDTLIYAPTARIPSLIRNSQNAYLSTLAALQVLNANLIKMDEEQDYKVAISGMGAGHGKMLPEYVASQMKAAWDMFLNPELPKGFREAAKRNFIMGGFDH